MYPHEAQIALKRLSVLTPVGAALIGLSVGQTIDFQTPADRNAVVDCARYIKLFPERSPTPFVTANVDWPRDSVAIGCEDP